MVWCLRHTKEQYKTILVYIKGALLVSWMESWMHKTMFIQWSARFVSYCTCLHSLYVQGGSNMTRTDCVQFTDKWSRSYMNHLVPIFFFRYMIVTWHIIKVLFWSSIPNTDAFKIQSSNPKTPQLVAHMKQHRFNKPIKSAVNYIMLLSYKGGTMISVVHIMGGAIPPFPQMPSWCVQRPLYFTTRTK